MSYRPGNVAVCSRDGSFCYARVRLPNQSDRHQGEIPDDTITLLKMEFTALIAHRPMAAMVILRAG